MPDPNEVIRNLALQLMQQQAQGPRPDAPIGLSQVLQGVPGGGQMDPTITALLQGMQQRMAPQATQAPTTNQPTSLTSGPVAKKWKASELKQDPTPYMVAVDAFIASQGLGAGEALGGSTKEPGKNTGSEPMSALKVKADAIRGQAVDNLLKAGVRADLLGQWLNSHKNIQYEEGQKSQAFQRAMRIAEFQRDGPILVQAAKEGHIEGVSKDLVPDPEKETEEQQEAKRKTLRKLYDYVAKMPSGEYIGVAKGKGWRWVNNLTRMDRGVIKDFSQVDEKALQAAPKSSSRLTQGLITPKPKATPTPRATPTPTPTPSTAPTTDADIISRFKSQ